ncbi:flagellar protein FlgN [Peribacillus kribbensis]|uniref:flagellar protein FlgN n=1 Tax=Peribacillus kribbensis TaxID=356658 RepID=UPI0004089E3C|nr:flagellar protein FlgN [Peribacillus kribbensis]
MPAQNIISAMAKLLKLHKSLLDLARQKTEIVKQGSMEELNRIMIDEQKHVKAITVVEAEREQAVAMFLAAQGSYHLQPSLAACLEFAAEEERTQFITLREDLKALVYELKDANFLNQQLIYQSLQFINMSLDMVRPRPQAFNYERPMAAGAASAAPRSYFNSKA